MNGNHDFTSTQDFSVKEKRKLDIFRVYRARVEFEYNLISQRITWPLLAGGAIGAGIIAASHVSVAGGQLNYWVLVVGFAFLTLMFLAVACSILAALSEVRRLTDLYKTACEKDGLTGELKHLDEIFVGSIRTHLSGNIFPWFVIVVPTSLSLIFASVFAGMALSG